MHSRLNQEELSAKFYTCIIRLTNYHVLFHRDQSMVLMGVAAMYTPTVKHKILPDTKCYLGTHNFCLRLNWIFDTQAF
jgi:hypothetical protein